MIPIQIDDQLWLAFAAAAQRQRKEPQTLLSELIREYLESEEDETLFEEMRQDLGGLEMGDEEAVAFVHQHRRGKREA
ncbi:MAG: hypothetical protein ACUVV0_07230 [Anaerolineae bacterium]